MMYSFKVAKEEANERIDKYLSLKLLDFTRSAIQKLFEEQKIVVNKKTASKSYKVCENDEIQIEVEEPKSLDIKAEKITLDIVYEDKDLLVVNKPQGMVVHPAAGNYEGTMVNALMAHCGDSLSGINGVIRPGIVHRIDKNTSGLLIVAKNNKAHLKLSEQIKEHSFTRIYEAVVIGNIKNDSSTINAPIGRHQNDRKKMAVTEKNSRNATTHFEVIERFKGYTHIKCKLETGRTHQIRVHLSHLGHPILGDNIYGAKTNSFGLIGQCLYAKTIGFIHPTTGEYMEFSSPIPEYFEMVLTKLKKTATI
jgi:23S rRNA pseudouridine1911/1915/1917 synthase